MNNQNTLGRPPSYTYNTAGRPTSPLPPGQPMPHHPPPLNTNLPYPQSSMAPMGAPPGYGLQQQLGAGMAPGLHQPQYGVRNPAVEVEGAGRSKAQLIVGIDFGTTFSGVAFAFATNNEAREDIITEWPGAGTHTKQKVPRSTPPPSFPPDDQLTNQSHCLARLDPNRSVLRSVPKGGGLGPGYC